MTFVSVNWRCRTQIVGRKHKTFTDPVGTVTHLRASANVRQLASVSQHALLLTGNRTLPTNLTLVGFCRQLPSDQRRIKEPLLTMHWIDIAERLQLQVSRVSAAHSLIIIYIHRESKKQDTKLLAITPLTIIRFSNFFTSRLGSKFTTNSC